jgi:Transporter associated domain
VTPIDLLEALVGDIPETGMPVEPSLVRREDGSWLVDGMLPIDEFKERIALGPLPREGMGAYQTVRRCSASSHQHDDTTVSCHRSCHSPITSFAPDEIWQPARSPLV